VSRDNDFENDDFDDELDEDLDEDFAGLPAPAAPVFGSGEVKEGHRSGFACFVGRPNVGKSTLTNAIVGQKVVITSDKPQTTRTVVRGIVHREDGQLILVDTPGLHRPRNLLGERLNDLVKATWAEVDVVAVCFPSDQKIGPGDRFLVEELGKVRRTVKIAVATKTDLVDHERLGEHLLDIAQLGAETGTDWAEIVPVSSVSGHQIELLASLLVGLMPEGPPLYPDGDLTDAPEEILAATRTSRCSTSTRACTSSATPRRAS
jgi:GTP-binding protein Era